MFPIPLTPYSSVRANLFGQYTLHLSRMPPPVDYDLPILSPMDSGDQLATGAAAGD